MSKVTGRRFRMPCLVCGVLTDGGSRCDKHEAQYQQQNKRVESRERKAIKRERYNTNYQRIAKRIRLLAISNATECYLCGIPLVPGDDVQIDHVYPDRGTASPLLPTHAVCNRRKSNKQPNI